MVRLAVVGSTNSRSEVAVIAKCRDYHRDELLIVLRCLRCVGCPRAWGLKSLGLETGSLAAATPAARLVLGITVVIPFGGLSLRCHYRWHCFCPVERLLFSTAVPPTVSRIGLGVTAGEVARPRPKANVFNR